MPRNNAAIERWAEVPVEILTLTNGKVWRITHTTVGKLADPIGGEADAIRHAVMNSESYIVERRSIVTVTRLCKCEE